MKFFNFKKKKAQTIGHRSVLSRVGRDPRIDWVLIVAISCILTVVLVFVGVEKYSNFDGSLQKKISTTDSKVSASIDTKSLDAVLERFDKKASDRAEALRGYSGPADPSI
jgi:hypothetical protein